MKMAAFIFAMFAIATAFVQSAEARSYHRHYYHRSYHHPRIHLDANANAVAGNVVSHKTGAHASVSPTYAPQFQAYIDDLEAHGAKIKFMGGYRPGQCSSRHMHSCNKALDVCQRRRDVVDPSCLLPGRRELAEIAMKHGLFEGGRWHDGDMGHAQVGDTTGTDRFALSSHSDRERIAHVDHHHRRSRSYAVAYRNYMPQQVSYVANYY